VSNIIILPDIVANKIAAGEVVERPASVVKELVENAIDAGASRVHIDVESGGRRLVRVADNGSGMGREDALLSIERHATSKIQAITDIDAIATLGFRGEALPSIVSVSRTIIDTKREEDDLGTRLIVEGGVLRDVTDIGLNRGTIVEVRNLFFNVPARRKFLRTGQTEITHIKNMLYTIAVSSPGLDLSLSADGRELFSYRGSHDRHGMLRQIFGASMTERMIPIAFEEEGFAFEGFLGRPDTARNTGIHQYIIVNGRPIVSRNISRAVRDGYGPGLPRGMFPAFVLYIEAEQGLIDVNVHPTKREVRIHREFVIARSLRENVAMTMQTMSAAPDLASGRGRFPAPPGSSEVRPVTVYNPPQDRWSPEIVRGAGAGAGEKRETSQTALPLEPQPSAHDADVRLSVDAESFSGGEGPRFWQLKDRYIVTTVKEGAIIIDQHVAHERILYEEVLEHFKGRQAAAQQLLFPLVLDFPAADYDILEPMIPFLNRVGFGMQEFGERSVMVDAVPSWLRGGDTEYIFGEYIDEMRLHGRISSGYMEKLAAAIACRSAIKAGMPLKQEEMQSLADRLFATSAPFVCPHGRPTIVKLTLRELDRRFGR